MVRLLAVVPPAKEERTWKELKDALTEAEARITELEREREELRKRMNRAAQGEFDARQLITQITNALLIGRKNDLIRGLIERISDWKRYHKSSDYPEALLRRIKERT